MEVLIGEAKKEFNTEVTENTENAEKKRKQERDAGAQRSICLRNFEAALQEAEEAVGEESEECSGDGAGEDESIADEGEAGDGLENAGDGKRDGAQRWALHNEHAERDAYENGNDHGDEDEHEMIESGAENFFAVSGEERPGGHLGAHAGATGGMARDEVKGGTSGWSRRRNSCGAALATMRPASSRTMRAARSSASRKA